MLWLEFYASFEILNASVLSPVRLDNPASRRFPEVKMFSLFAYKNDDKVLDLIKKDNRPRRTARAIVLIETEDAEQALAKASDFVHIVCDLQGLAQRNSVTFWGATAYLRAEGFWKPHRKSWRVTRTDPSWSLFGHSVATTELQGHFRKWLATIDEPDFPLDDFANSTHLLSDSYRSQQFLEVMFLEDWVAFELLVNQLAEKTEIDESARKRVLKELTKGVEQYIEQEFRNKLDDESYGYVKEQLSGLRRIPVGHLIERFAQRYGIDLKNYRIETLKKIRNGLMHFGKEPSDYDLWVFHVKMRQLLEDSLLSMVRTKEANKSERPSPGLPSEQDRPPMEEDLAEYSMSFDAQVRDEKGQSLTTGKFDVRWTCDEIKVSGKAEDPMSLWGELGNQPEGYSLSGRGAVGVVTVSNAHPTRLREFDLEMRALRVEVDYTG